MDIQKIIHISDLHICKKNFENIMYAFDTILSDIKTLNEKCVIIINGNIFANKSFISSHEGKCFHDIVLKLNKEQITTFINLGYYDYDISDNDIKNIDKDTFVDNISMFISDDNSYVKLLTDDIKKYFPKINFVISNPIKIKSNIRTVKNNEITKNIAIVYDYIPCSTYETDRCHQYNTHLTMDLLETFDIVMLGGIRKHQFIKPNIAYSGSLTQCDINENYTNHGYIIWDLQTNQGVFKEIIPLQIDLIIELNDDQGQIPIIKNIRDLTLKFNNCSHEWIEQFYNNIYNNFQNTNINKVITNNIIKHQKDDVYFDDVFSSQKVNENELKFDVQYENIFNKMLLDNTSDEKIQNDLRNLHSIEVHNRTVKTYNNWNLQYLTWSNLLCYDAENHINFAELKSLVSLLGNNRSGKSSVIDILTFALYNKSSKGNKEILNKNKEFGYVKCAFTVNNDIYVIEQVIHKSKKDTLFRLLKNEQNITKESIKETYAYISHELGIGTYDEFINITTALQNRIFLTHMDSKTRYNMICKILEIDVFIDIENKINKDILYLKKHINKNIKDIQKYDNVEKINNEKIELQNQLNLLNSDYSKIQKDLDFIYKKKASIVGMLQENTSISDLQKNMKIYTEKHRQLKNKDFLSDDDLIKDEFDVINIKDSIITFINEDTSDFNDLPNIQKYMQNKIKNLNDKLNRISDMRNIIVGQLKELNITDDKHQKIPVLDTALFSADEIKKYKDFDILPDEIEKIQAKINSIHPKIHRSVNTKEELVSLRDSIELEIHYLDNIKNEFIKRMNNSEDYKVNTNNSEEENLFNFIKYNIKKHIELTCAKLNRLKEQKNKLLGHISYVESINKKDMSDINIEDIKNNIINLQNSIIKTENFYTKLNIHEIKTEIKKIVNHRIFSKSGIGKIYSEIKLKKPNIDIIDDISYETIYNEIDALYQKLKPCNIDKIQTINMLENDVLHRIETITADLENNKSHMEFCNNDVIQTLDNAFTKSIDSQKNLKYSESCTFCDSNKKIILSNIAISTIRNTVNTLRKKNNAYQIKSDKNIQLQTELNNLTNIKNNIMQNNIFIHNKNIKETIETLTIYMKYVSDYKQHINIENKKKLDEYIQINSDFILNSEIQNITNIKRDLDFVSNKIIELKKYKKSLYNLEYLESKTISLYKANDAIQLYDRTQNLSIKMNTFIKQLNTLKKIHKAYKHNKKCDNYIKHKNNDSKLKVVYNKLTEKINRFNNTIAYIENLFNLKQTESQLQLYKNKNLSDDDIDTDKYMALMKDLYYKILVIQNRIELLDNNLTTINNFNDKINRLKSEYCVKQMYLKLINHKTGLPSKIMKYVCDVFSKKCNDVLNDITNFEIQFEHDKEIQTYFVQNNIRISASAGSGFQLFVTDLIMRVVLSQISRVGTPNFIIIDEGFGCLDESNLINVSKCLTKLANEFKYIIVISHSKEMDQFMNININIDNHKLCYGTLKSIEKKIHLSLQLPDTNIIPISIRKQQLDEIDDIDFIEIVSDKQFKCTSCDNIFNYRKNSIKRHINSSKHKIVDIKLD